MTVTACMLLCAPGRGAAMAGDASGRSGAPPSVRQEPIVPLKSLDELHLDAALVRLGARLFADPRLSRSGRMSCASCHPLDRAGVDGRRRALGNGGARARNTPTVFNVGNNLFFNWDASSETLEEHDDKVLRNPAIMNMTWPELASRLRADRGYAAEFGRLPVPGVTRDNVLAAIAAFERSLTTPDSRFDRYLRGDDAALTPDELAGYRLFKNYGCIACHQGINVGGNLRQKFGVFADPDPLHRVAAQPDLGHFGTSKREADREVFRVPSLRNVAVTPPYFHDGRAPTLEVAVETMARVQLGRQLQADQIRQIVLFLRTLTGRYQGRSLQRVAEPGD